MKSDNLPGLSPLWLILLALALGTFLAAALPLIILTKDVMPADWLGFSGGIIGAGCTIFAGWLAYSAVQVQIKDYRDAARKSAFAALDERVFAISQDIDRLKLAIGFLANFTDGFPPSSERASTGGFTEHLRQTRLKALDFLSASATNAPYGYGAIISTVMSRVQRLGDRMDERSLQQNWAAVIMYYDPLVKEAIAGIRGITEQIKVDIPIHEAALLRAIDERDRFR
jgi:hypothetical protein